MPCRPGLLRSKKNRLARSSPAELRQLFAPWLELPPRFGNPKRTRLFTPTLTFWLFLSQVLAQDWSCRETVRKFLAWLASEKSETASPQTAAYCKARARLDPKELRQAHRRVTKKIEAKANGHFWCGRRVKVADGSSISMPDTPANQNAWPQPKKQKPGCGFPVMRLGVIFSIASGALLEVALGSLACHERTLIRTLWPTLKRGEVLLADRGFCGYADFLLLARQGVDCVMRKHQRRKNAARVHRLGPHDHLVLWRKTGPCPKWLEEKTWRELPETLIVREIKIQVGIPGFRTQTIFLATTLLDPAAFPAHALANLYRRRWMAELYLRDIKTTMEMDVLRCKTPPMIATELWMHLIAYNLIRALILEAALKSGLAPEQLSLKGTISTVRQWAAILAQPTLDEKTRHQLHQTMLKYLAQDPLPFRPNRLEPRTRKRRPKNYQLLNQPRKLFREFQHRNKYRKA